MYFDIELSSPWVTATPPSREIADKVMPGAERVIEYHLFASGTGWGHAIGQEPIRLREGDLIVFPQGDPHVLSSAPGMQAKPDMSIFARPSTSLPIVYEFGGGGPDRARIVCCFLGCDERPYNPLLAALPSVIHLSAADPRRRRPDGWARCSSIAAKEAGSARPGGENVLARLSELMFVETIRQLSRDAPARPDGLAGRTARSRRRTRAGRDARRAERSRGRSRRLARLVGLSRSVLAERFTDMVGQPPMQYLALWRMQLASRLLADGGQVAAVADAVGYESEAAFSRAFKKLVGQAPATWRRRSATTASQLRS